MAPQLLALSITWPRFVAPSILDGHGGHRSGGVGGGGGGGGGGVLPAPLVAAVARADVDCHKGEPSFAILLFVSRCFFLFFFPPPLCPLRFEPRNCVTRYEIVVDVKTLTLLDVKTSYLFFPPLPCAFTVRSVESCQMLSYGGRCQDFNSTGC